MGKQIGTPARRKTRRGRRKPRDGARRDRIMMHVRRRTRGGKEKKVVSASSRKDTQKDTEALRANERGKENDGRAGSREKGPSPGRKRRRRIMRFSHGAMGTMRRTRMPLGRKHGSRRTMAEQRRDPPVRRKGRRMSPNHGHRRASRRPLTGTSAEQTRLGGAKCLCRQVGCVERCRQTLPAAFATRMCAKGAGGMTHAGTVTCTGICTIRSITVVTVSSRMAGANCT